MAGQQYKEIKNLHVSNMQKDIKASKELLLKEKCLAKEMGRRSGRRWGDDIRNISVSNLTTVGRKARTEIITEGPSWRYTPCKHATEKEEKHIYFVQFVTLLEHS